METNKYNRRKVKNYLDRHAISVYLNVFTKVSDIILKTKGHSSLSRLTQSLETKGLINKKLEGKKVYISVSEKGKNYLDRLYSIFNRQSGAKNFHTSEEEDLMYCVSEGYREKKIA